MLSAKHEALAGVASGIVVVLPSLQLIQSIRAIKVFAQGTQKALVEFQRPTGSLEHLEILLEDVRQLIERQTTVQQATDSCNLSLLRRLKGCDKSSRPLQIVVERSHEASSHSHFLKAKLRRDFSFGQKSVDIAELERTVDRETDRLSLL
ncbi:uncharacterized protein M421DRAFT_416356 [Didymella exigua CBS 183.55]|uniref:Fungal N-terminal domain-containing protein n=1 Tax=Didymella exigua CBS 183.55 TaxID=1150837 RepID=A0A6A5RYR0_9PLEO|nr:uncharacterized protein M421DRAFT_416356 [Didymella exigua CBS 183.55]KAF1932743.1 hypothetical protein M421DRAFT_416356 [Didymella exigua CBS 183.55]